MNPHYLRAPRHDNNWVQRIPSPSEFRRTSFASDGLSCSYQLEPCTYPVPYHIRSWSMVIMDDFLPRFLIERSGPSLSLSVYQQ